MPEVLVWKPGWSGAEPPLTGHETADCARHGACAACKPDIEVISLKMKSLFVLHLDRCPRYFCDQAGPAFEFKFNHVSALTLNSAFNLSKSCLFANISEQVDLRRHAHLMCSFRLGEYT
jgi:hypothetical protein